MEIKATAPHLADAADGFRNSGAWPDTVLDHVALASAANPGQPALVDRRERFDYQGLDSAIDDCASEPRRHVQEQDSVVVVAANDCRSAIAVHALRRIGAVCILISDHAEEKEIAQALERTSPRIAMAPRRMIDQLSDRHPSVRWMSTSTEGVDGVSREPFASSTSAPNLPGVVVFTSGSTSRPKGVVHSTNTLQVAAANYIEAAGLSASDVFILVSPLSSITGVLQALVMAPMLGGCVVFEDQWDDAGTFDLLLNEQATFYGGPDVILRRLLEEAERRDLSSVPLRAVSVGGAQLDTHLLRRAEKLFQICVMRAYGSSEAPFSTTTPYTTDLEDRLELDGLPNRGVEVRIGSERDGSECLVRGPHLFLGYLDAEDNEDAFESGWFRTGDAGVLRRNQLKIVGRLKEIVIRNGMKISMTQVEEAARNLAFIEDAAAFSQPDQDTGEHLALAVRPKDGIVLDLDMVTNALLECGLAKRGLPEELIVWDGPFPMTVTAKLSRAALAEESAGRPRLLVSRLQP